MQYDNGEVRRQDRLMGEEQARELLHRAEYGFLALATEEGGYGVPINYAIDGSTIYLHCALEGRKLRAIEHDARVSFCVVGRVEVVPEEFSTQYESVIVAGRARIVESETEKRTALRLIVEKYAAEHMEQGMQAIERSVSRTAIIAIEASRFSGKVKVIR